MAYEYLLRLSEPSAPSTWYYLGSTHGRSTTPSDTPAGIWVPSGVANLNFEVTLFDGIDPSPSSKGGFGTIRIADPDGDLDYLIGKVTSGGTLQILRGTPGAAFSGFSVVATLTTAGMLYGGAVKNLRVRDLGWMLDTPLHDNRYDGTGDANGDATITGIIRPYAVGPCFNVTGQMVKASKRIIQLSDGKIWSVADVRDGGVSLAFGADRANFAAMDAATPPAASYDTCLAQGYIRLGSAPVYGITVDFTGDATGAPFLKRGDIAKRIVSRAGTGLTTSQVDSTALTAFNTAQPADCNFFWNQEVTKREALNQVMEGCLGYWYVNLTGNLVLGSLDDPTGTALATYTWPEDFATEPESIDTFADPRWKTMLGWQRNYTIQERSQLGSVTDANAQLYKQDAQWQTWEISGQRTNWPTSPAVKRFAGYVNQSDAYDEAKRQATVFQGAPFGSRNKERLSFVLREDPITFMGYLGGVIAIAGYTRYGWSNPRKVRPIGVSFSGDSLTKAIVWG